MDTEKHPPITTVAEKAVGLKTAPRLRVPDRAVVLPAACLDELLPPDDLARLVWRLVEPLDLSAWYHDIKAVGGVAGRDANDPRLLFALWLLACLNGVSSARELARLAQRHLSYRWLCGGVTVNRDGLARFRVGQPERLSELLSQCVAALMAEGLCDLGATAQDGLRVRACAGSGSFRRRARLEGCLPLARQAVAQLHAQDDRQATPRQRAAGQRAARQRQERIEAALRHVRQLEQQKEQRHQQRPDEKDKDRPPRASTTDPQCRRMKMADGGYRPAYNVQLCTTVETGVVVGVEVSNEGSDYGQTTPMLDQLRRRYHQAPQRHLVDGGFVSKEAIEEAARAHAATELYAPVKNAAKEQAAGRDPYRAKKGDKPAVAQWRRRMGTEEAKQVYRHRPATAELPNAQLRNRGLYQVRVRGQQKVKAVVLWLVLALNLMRAEALRAAARK